MILNAVWSIKLSDNFYLQSVVKKILNTTTTYIKNILLRCWYNDDTAHITMKKH